MTYNLKPLLVGLALLVAGLPLAYQLWPARTPGAPAAEANLAESRFALVDEDGQRATGERLRGRWTLLFFGFTQCPDVCPTALGEVAAVLDRLGDDAGRVQAWFVSVDPQRDTPAVLARYTDFFDPRIQGLSGAPDGLAPLTQALGVYVERVPLGDGYGFDHTARFFLLGPDGRVLDSFAPDTGPEPMAQRIAAHVDADTARGTAR